MRGSRKLLRIVIAFVVCAAVGAVVASWMKREEQKTKVNRPGSGHFKVGVITSADPADANFSQSIRLGAKFAAREINAQGGVLNQTVKIAPIRFNQPGSIYEQIKRKIKKKRPSLLVGTTRDEETLAAIRVAEEERIPFIYVGNGAIKTCRRGNAQLTSDYVWGVGLTKEMTVETFLVNLADKLRKPEKSLRIYYFSTDEPIARSQAVFARETAESLDFQTVGEEYVDERIKDYFQRIRAIFDRDPELLYASLSGKAIEKFMQQAAKLNLKKEMSVAGLECFDEEHAAYLGSALDGVYTASRYSPALDNPANKKFLAAWHKEHPENPTALAASTYGAVLLAAAAFNNARSSDPLAFKQAMEDSDLNLPQGKVIVSKYNHLLVQPLYLLKIEGGDYRIEDFLGDVSHPLLEGCIVPQPQTQPTPTPTEFDDED